MVISHSHRFIFVHVAKTAGSAIHGALLPHRHDPRQYLVNRLLERCGIRVNHYGPHIMRRFRIHERAITIKRHLPQDVFSGYFKFAFVRNPWDLMVSRYAFILSRPYHKYHKKIQGLGSFERFVEFSIRRNHGHQHPMITDRRGELLVDFVGRFERLHEDFAQICRKIGVEAELPHTNRSKHKHYSAYYDTRTAEMIREHLARDIEMFGYQFDSPVQSRPAQPNAA